MLAGHQAKIAHQLTGTVEARQVAKFGQHGHRRDDVDAAQADQGFHHRLQRPRLHCQVNLVLKVRYTALSFQHHLHVLLEHNLLNRMAEGLLLQPAKVRLGPAASSLVDPVMMQQERTQALTCLELDRLHVLAGPRQVVYRFLVTVGKLKRRRNASARPSRVRWVVVRSRQGSYPDTLLEHASEALNSVHMAIGVGRVGIDQYRKLSYLLEGIEWRNPVRTWPSSGRVERRRRERGDQSHLGIAGRR